MNEEQREKLAILKTSNKEYVKKMQWENNILLQECLNALEAYKTISDQTMIKNIIKIACSIKINRMCYSDRIMIEKSHDYYIVWDNAEVPIIKCKGECIFENWNDVIAVAFDICFIDCETEKGFLIRE